MHNRSLGHPAQSDIKGARGPNVKLTFIRKTAQSQVNNCPSLYRTDRDTFIVQGWRVSDPEALAQLDIPAHETAVEVPADVLAEIAKVR